MERINDNPYGLTLGLDQESEKNVNFLDISITCKEGEIWTGIYRKPVYQPIIIPKNSIDTKQVKYAAFRAWIKRAYTHCTSLVDTYEELDYIQKVATQQGYHRKEIEALIKRMQIQNQQPPEIEQRKNVVINYFPFLNKIIRKVANKNKLRIIYRRNPTVYRLLRNDKKKDNRNSLTGIYSIPIKDRRFNTNLVYVGATMRSLRQRLKEHKYSMDKNIDSTVLAAFAKKQDVTVYWDSAAIVRATRSLQAVKHLEKIEIHKAHLATGCINHRDAEGLATAWRSFYNNTS
ncbi:uncharacterized protein LOC111617489 [Centruroides sculpturatus]|uniref:uncharacterized protein LOC111617489 n=1 Tax=Centruroides sculpturatus TaxID=218467 RepID=UPI000C6EAF2B|nr:uncharacterized protein LOC111617489 [Centruroides sculpturatus]